MTDNLTIREVNGEWVVMTSVSKKTIFVGTKEECENYLENN